RRSTRETKSRLENQADNRPWKRDNFNHLYTQARQRNPARWSGSTRNWAPVQSVTLNPERDGIADAAATASNTQPRAA
ncbi:hypothetical protein, partial [Paracidovorax avenae]|uniref:hypothetical protein n=1 Tax=Paracidovorax avenae TaxID=80867 RepID=UPI001F337E92